MIFSKKKLLQFDTITSKKKKTEPTSGLDATTAYSICNALRILAKNTKMTIICTIHQPRREIFAMFSKFLVLAGGQTVHKLKYFTQNATIKTFSFHLQINFSQQFFSPYSPKKTKVYYGTNPKSYFENVSEILCPRGMNEADFIMDACIQLQKEEKIVPMNHIHNTRGQLDHFHFFIFYFHFFCLKKLAMENP